MSTQPTIGLNDGNVIPQLGFGVWQVPNEEAAKVVGPSSRLDSIHRYIISTKLWNDKHSNARSALNKSLSRLGLDHVDLT